MLARDDAATKAVIGAVLERQDGSRIKSGMTTVSGFRIKRRRRPTAAAIPDQVARQAP
jgi:hypothetical protein